MHLNAITLDLAKSEALRILEKAKAQLGFIPNMYTNMVNSPELLDTYLDGYTRFRQNSAFSPIEQEVVFLTISRENNCNYCMAAHSVIADNFSHVPENVTNSIRDNLVIQDKKLEMLSKFTKIMLLSRGRPTSQETQAFLQAGYTDKNILDIILAIAVKTMSNYTNHLFDTEVDAMFAQRSWTPQS